MASTNVNRTLKSLRRDLDLLDKQREAIERAIRSLEEVLRRSGGVPSADATGATQRRRGATTEAVLAIVNEAGGPITDKDIVDRLAERGMAPRSKTNPLHATRATLSRMVSSGKLERIAASTYQIPDPAPHGSSNGAGSPGEASLTNPA